jgi:hypothetical protein
MAPKINSESLIETFSDTKVTSALVTALTPLFTSMTNVLDKRIDSLLAAINELKLDNNSLRVQNDSIKAENICLKKQLSDQCDRIDELEIYSRSDNLIIKGLPEKTYAERGAGSLSRADELPVSDSHRAVEETVISFCRQSLQVDVSPQDISVAHRLRAGKKDQVRPVIVRFTNRRVRDDVYRARKLLKDNQEHIYINEHLTKSTANLLYESRQLIRDKKLHSAWTQHGQVYAKFTSDSTVRPTQIKRSSDFNPRP